MHGGRRGPTSENGSALVIALLVMVIMTLLGIPFLLMGETENRIAENERLALQAQYVAESGARMVKRWFDYPMHASNAINPPLAAIDRSLRLIDADGDPGTATEPADGSPEHPFYKQDTDAVFDEPYSGSLTDELLGTADGPDMVIDAAASEEARAFLDQLSLTLYDEFPGKGRRAKVSRIDVYAAPYHPKDGSWVRHGVGAVKVMAGVYQQEDGGDRLLAQRMVRFVFDAIPYTPEDTHKLGALHSCDDIQWGADPFNVHWGLVTAEEHISFEDHRFAAAGLPRLDELDWNRDPIGFAGGGFTAYRAAIEGQRIEDPWLRVLAGNEINDATVPVRQPWPFPSWTGSLQDGQYTYHADDPVIEGSHSGYLQSVRPELEQRFGERACPTFSYDVWKAVAQHGGPNVHYYRYDLGESEFVEDRTGAHGSFRDLTDNKAGLFFFDTEDNEPPSGGNEYFDNLTPDINVEGQTWSARGFIFLNAHKFRVKDAAGRPTAMRMPGEPFVDQDADGVRDDSEEWINLNYEEIVDLGSEIKADWDDLFGATEGERVWNSQGPVFTADVNFHGILYTNGKFVSTGHARYYGSVVAWRDVGYQDSIDDPDIAGTPEIYADPSLQAGDWPPPELGLPRVVVMQWETGL